MAGYMALPNELKDLVNLSQKDISRLSRTSKSMRKALVPQLFRRISLNWEAFKPPPRISGILGAVLQSSDVAEAVEELSFHGKGYRRSIWNPEKEHRPKQKNIPDRLFEAKPKPNGSASGLKPLLEKEMRRIKLPKSEWKLVLGGEDMLDFIIATIIVHCPNLKVLRLGTDFIHENKCLPKVLNHFLGLKPGSSKSALTKLERVYLGQDITYWSNTSVKPHIFPPSSCLLFFYLPSLEIFSVPLPDHVGYSEPEREYSWRPPPRPTEWPTTTAPTCTVRTLDLYRTRARPAHLTFILAQTPHLRSLHYDHWPRTFEKLDCAELRSALESVSHTLTELTISVEPFTRCAEEIDENGSWVIDEQGLGSLVSLSHLTKLEISFPILLRWDGDGLGLEDVLPSSLEEFCLRDDFTYFYGMMWDEERTVEEVRRWLENKAWKKCTPNLKRFGLRLCRARTEEWGIQRRNTLMDICRREGLECWYEKLEPDYELSSKGIYEITSNQLRYPL